jgi:DNA (cytosine-5)-methyltransferase 1
MEGGFGNGAQVIFSREDKQMNYYNEIEPYAVDWLWNLIDAKLIPGQTVDRRSIVDVGPETLGHDRCHFFAGLGGWELALQMAGWPEDWPVWTGSCPCQPFSISGKKKGKKDARHLWPAFRSLIKDCRPPVVFGEQVASPLGRKWLSGVRSDLEELGYTFGAADLCAAGVGAPHRRQRLFWAADASGWKQGNEEVQRGGEYGFRAPNGVPLVGAPGAVGAPHGMGDAGRAGLEERPGQEVEPGAVWSEGDAAAAAGPWGRFFTVSCSDGKTRRLEPGVAPLAHGIPARMGKIRAYGNAIVPQVAATFIRAYIEIRQEIARGRIADARREVH